MEMKAFSRKPQKEKVNEEIKKLKPNFSKY